MAVMSTQRNMIIIGGGIAGLCAGVYARKRGFATDIFEMHNIAGGLATAWKRGGYTFENCVHWLVGSKKGADLNNWWREVFDIDQLEFYESAIQSVTEHGGEKITIYRDNDALERELLSKAPEDAQAIKTFMRDVRRLTRFRIPMGDNFLQKIISYMRAIPYLPLLSSASKITVGEYGKRFKNPLLRSSFQGTLSDLSQIAILFSFAWMNSGNGGYPLGGSLRMIGLIEENYRKLGGDIRFNARVKRILVENGRAQGVELEGGETFNADVVISAADAHSTLFDMLGEKYLDEQTKMQFKTLKPFPSYLMVSLGVAREFAGEPELLSILLDEPIRIDDRTELDNASYRIFNYDPNLAPMGKTAIVSFIPTYNYEYWARLKETSPAKYESEKQRVADKIIDIFDKRYPGSKDKIEVVDVATPATVFRYTNNWQGSMEGWLLTPATGAKQLPCTVPGIRDFYMVGQWISPGGGLPSGLMTAREVINGLS
ncbi:MAG TPA: NAD(P)/FAD-dependent oxidoreductase [Acidobacteriota bacterium]|nr:NAD(P)/FAD-dependent oxidoreductase [Acidobacteriota bacterium]